MALQDDFDALDKSLTDLINRKVSGNNRLLKIQQELIDKIEAESDLQKRLLEIKKVNQKLDQGEVKLGQKTLTKLKTNLKLAEAIVKQQQLNLKYQKLYEKQQERLNSLMGKFSSGISDIADQIPIIGSAIVAAFPFDKLEAGFRRVFQTATAGAKGFGLALRSTGVLAVIAAITGAVALFGASTKVKNERDGLIKDIKTQVGLTGNLMGLNAGNARLAEGYSSLLSEIRSQMHFIDEEAIKATSQFQDLVSLSRISADQIAVMYDRSKLFQESTEDTLKTIEKIGDEYGNQRDVLKEFASLSDQIFLSFRGTLKELVKQVKESKKFGLNLERAQSAARGLLDIEQSLEAEFETQLLLGRRFDLSRARALALEGRDLESIQEAFKQIGIQSLDDFTNLNRIVRESVLGALNLDINDLTNIFRTQQKGDVVEGDIRANLVNDLTLAQERLSQQMGDLTLKLSDAFGLDNIKLEDIINKFGDAVDKFGNFIDGLEGFLSIFKKSDRGRSPLTSDEEENGIRRFLTNYPTPAEFFEDWTDDGKLNQSHLGGSTSQAKTNQLLQDLVAALDKGMTIQIDGQKVGEAIYLGNPGGGIS